jgi:DNA-binding LacI/PurR family transcriptional regulator
VVESTRRQVLAAMRQLGYRPNSAARALKRGEFRTIGVILFTLATTGNSRTVEAIATHAAQEGYAITLIPVACRPRTGCSARSPGSASWRSTAIIVIMEVHLLDAAT